ncbi:hypothetical protein B0T22DRAFT_196418 [Podospora appendiculata]|uniref:Uncharacterized protein n=1 Tax=Podospora appendiculata TaxID=314037 RepID=A0AAE1C9P7_9PEZI|nr:hypothetical protein B0T22DRAFT_196418 [Podospora appendiculata]
MPQAQGQNPGFGVLLLAWMVLPVMLAMRVRAPFYRNKSRQSLSWFTEVSELFGELTNEADSKPPGILSTSFSFRLIPSQAKADVALSRPVGYSTAPLFDVCMHWSAVQGAIFIL